MATAYERTSLVFKNREQKNVITAALKKFNKESGNPRKESFSSFMISFAVAGSEKILADSEIPVGAKSES